MPIPIPYPQTTGFREGFQSVVWKINRNNIGFGFKTVEGGVKRDRGIVWGANSEPLGKTRGKSTYTLAGEIPGFDEAGVSAGAPAVAASGTGGLDCARRLRHCI